MLRRAAVIAAGLAMATSFGFAGAGMASAAAPALKIKPGAIWSMEYNVGSNPCLQNHFEVTSKTSGGFNDEDFDQGTWSGGGSTIKMKWTAGTFEGWTFKGTYTTTPVKEYVGSFGGGGAGVTGQLVKGVPPGGCGT